MQTCISVYIGFPVFATQSVGALKMRNIGSGKKKDTRSSVFFLVTLPRFVGRRISDCRNSVASEFIRIAKRPRQQVMLAHCALHCAPCAHLRCLCPLRTICKNASQFCPLVACGQSGVPSSPCVAQAHWKCATSVGKRKDTRSNVFSLVTLPRFVGRRANDCRNSGASRFTCIATRQSGFPSSPRKAWAH